MHEGFLYELRCKGRSRKRRGACLSAGNENRVVYDRWRIGRRLVYCEGAPAQRLDGGWSDAINGAVVFGYPLLLQHADSERRTR